MMNGMFAGTALPALEQLVNFTQARHTVLAGNIANLDTPGYRTRDLSVEQFQSQMKEALAAQKQSATHASPGMPQGADPVAQVSRNLGSILRHDEGNVSIEQQVAELSKNQMQHNLALSIMQSQFRLLEAAISERA